MSPLTHTPSTDPGEQAHSSTTGQMLQHLAPGAGKEHIWTNITHAPKKSRAQVSTTTLLNALHNAYSSDQPYSLESSTSLVVNTWTARKWNGTDGDISSTVDVGLARRAWEHTRRRAEDSIIVLGCETISIHGRCRRTLTRP